MGEICQRIAYDWRRTQALTRASGQCVRPIVRRRKDARSLRHLSFLDIVSSLFWIFWLLSVVGVACDRWTVTCISFRLCDDGVQTKASACACTSEWEDNLIVGLRIGSMEHGDNDMSIKRRNISKSNPRCYICISDMFHTCTAHK